MKENEFLDGVSNIEPDVVERFVTMDNKLQSRSKRSRKIWIRVLALAACVALVIGVIATVVLLQGGETGQDIPAKPSLNERVFLSVQTMGGESTNGFVNSTVYGIDTSQNMETFEELKNTVKKLPFDDEKEFVYEYSQCAYKTSESQEYGTFYSIYDSYRYEKETIQYLHGTDLLCFYSVDDATIDGVTFPIQSEEEAKNAANAFLLSFLSETELDKFSEVSVESSSSFPFRVKYIRVIDGYKTDEELWVFFNKNGNFSGYNGYNLKKYDNLLDRISKEKLDEAKEILLDKILETDRTDFSYEDPQITTDTVGNIYLQIKYSYTTEEMFRQTKIALVSVN